MVKARYFLEACKDRLKKKPVLGSEYATYAVLGNLSHDLRSRWERRVGNANFSSEMASKISCVTNMAVYTALGYGLMVDPFQAAHAETGTPLSPQIAAGFLGFMVGGLEWFLRHMTEYKAGSLPGKAVSLPLEEVAKLCDHANEIEEAEAEEEYEYDE